MKLIGSYTSPFVRKISVILPACAIAYLNFRRVAPGWCATRPQLVKLVDALFQRASFARTEPPRT